MFKCLQESEREAKNIMKEEKIFGESVPECEISEVHKNAVENAKSGGYTEEETMKLAELYKVFGDTTRIRILSALMQGELCVCDISALLGMSVSAVSHQLRTLRESDLVRTKRDGKIIYYSLADEHVKSILECGLEHIKEKQ